MKNWILYPALSLLILLIIALGVAPNMITSYLNEHSKELAGRAFRIDDIDVNYLTGDISIENFYMLELNENDTFISFRELELNLAIARSAFGKPTIEELDLYGPSAVIIQDSAGFNFDDLIAFHSAVDPDEKDAGSEEEPYYLVKNINVHDGELKYTLTGINSTVGFNEIEVKCPQVSSDDPEITASASVSFLHGGHASADGMVNIESEEFLIHTNVDSLHLSFMEPILVEYMNISQLSGFASSSVNVTGSYENTDIINASGKFRAEAFDLRGPDSIDILYFNMLEVNMDTVELEQALFDIEYIKMDSVFTLFELYENGNNFERLLGSSGPGIRDTIIQPDKEKEAAASSGENSGEEESIYLTIAHSINSYFQEYSIAQYNIDELEVTRSAFIFRDFTLDDEFEYRITAMNASGKGLNSKKNRIRIDADCILNETGVFKGECELDPLNFLNLKMHYTISDFNIYDFSPHSRHYVAYPIMDGRMIYKCDLIIQDGVIENYNYIQINDFDFGDKDNKDPIYKLPVKLAASLLKDNKGVINLEVPVSGDLNDPKFHIWKTIMNILKNIIIKAATAPYKLVAGLFDGDEDAAENIYMVAGSGKLKEGYQKSAKGVFVTAQEKPTVDFEFVMMTDSVKDAGTLALVMMKEKYHKATSMEAITPDIGELIRNDDKSFVTYVDSLSAQTGFTGSSLESRCLHLADKSILSERYSNMNTARIQNLEKGLSDQLVPESRYRIRVAKPDEMINQQGIPKFRIQYTQSESTSSSE